MYFENDRKEKEGKGSDNHFNFLYPKKRSLFKKNKSIETLVFRNKKND